MFTVKTTWRVLKILCWTHIFPLLLAGCQRNPVATASHLDPPALATSSGYKATGGVPVICYHYFRSRMDPAYMAKVTGSLLFGLPALGEREFWTTPVGEFAKHLEFFRDQGIEVLTLDEVLALTQQGIQPPTPAVILTIDDADESVFKVAYPLLRSYGMRAHLFVPTAEVGQAWQGLHMCTWDQLREMGDSGTILLESHTNREHYKIATTEGFEPAFWHPESIKSPILLANLKDLNAIKGEIPGFKNRQWEKIRGGRFQAVTDDLLVSRAKLVDRTGAVAHWLAWPYGFGNGDLDSIAAMTGFSGTVSLNAQNFSLQSGPWHVGRLMVTAKTTLAQIKALFPGVATDRAALAQSTYP